MYNRFWLSKKNSNDSTRLMSSTVRMSGDSPPWTHKNWLLTRAASGRQSNAVMNKLYRVSEYFTLPAKKRKPHHAISRISCTMNRIAFCARNIMQIPLFHSLFQLWPIIRDITADGSSSSTRNLAEVIWCSCQCEVRVSGGIGILQSSNFVTVEVIAAWASRNCCKNKN